MRLTLRAVLVLSATLACPAASADADPIHIVYRIDVQRQCTFAGDAETCRPFRASFPLTLTFDDRIVNAHGDDLDRTQFYGEPSISEIPLRLRDDFPPFGPAFRQAAERARFSADDNAWLRESAVLIRQVASVDRNDFHRDFSLTANGAFPFAPALDARSFAVFLATAPFHQFSIADSVERADGGFELLSYAGDVSLAGSATTPEPASWLLVGSALASLTARRRRRGART